MKNILVVRFGTIGDTIFASAFLRELRKVYPDACIDFFADKIAKGVVKNCPYIDNIIDKREKLKDIFYYIKVFKQYDRVYFLKNDSFFTNTAALAGIRERIGFKIHRNKFLNKTAPYTEKKNEIDCYLELLEICGIKPSSNKTEVWINEQDENIVKDYLKNISNKKVIVQACSRLSYKNWIEAYWVSIIKYLVNEQNMQIFFAGGASDYSYYDSILKQAGNLKIQPINICGKFSVGESFAFIKNTDMFIGIDSGLVHAAAAMDIPSILINGPTSLERWAPRSKNCTVISMADKFPCHPCYLQKGSKKKCRRRTPDCILAITPEIVINAIEQKLK